MICLSADVAVGADCFSRRHTAVVNMGCKTSKPKESRLSTDHSTDERRKRNVSGTPRVAITAPPRQFRKPTTAFTSASFYDSVVRETQEVTVREDHRGNPCINNYHILRKLGHGQYAQVLLVVDSTTDELFAMKTLTAKSVRRTVSTLKRNGVDGKLSSNSQCDGELEILMKLRHPNINTLYEVIYDEQQNCLYLILEYMRGGQLCKLNRDGTIVGGARSYDQIRTIAGYLLDGLAYLHANKFAHRDLFPPNILLDELNVPKLIDFSTCLFSEDLDAEMDTSQLGHCTIAFLAPEFMQFGYAVSVRRAMAGDMWSLGIVLYALACGRLPFTGNDDTIRKRLLNSDAITLPPEIADMQLRSLLQQLLENEPTQRITAPQAQRHPFILGQSLADTGDVEAF
jgi:serine/threonine protein kinase